MLPNVIIYKLAASVTTAIVNATGTSSTGTLTLATSILDAQRRLLITAAKDESGNVFTVVGTNQAGFTITEAITGPNATTTQSNLDFKTVSSVTVATATLGVVSIGTDGAGSSLWNYVNYHNTPVNVALSGVIQTGTVTYTFQYTYDDPNNLPAGVAFPTTYNVSALTSQTTTLDGSISEPFVAWRVLINSGTGTLRATGIQAGISGP